MWQILPPPKRDGKVKGIAYGSSDISCFYKGFTFNTTAYIEDPEMIFGGKEIKNKDKLERRKAMEKHHE